MKRHSVIGALVFAFALPLISQPAVPADLIGTWEGTLDYQDEPLQVRLRVSKDSVVVDYPQLVFADQPAPLSVQGGIYTIELPMMGPFALDVSGDRVEGERRLESGATIRLDLTRGSPFITREVEIWFGDDESIGGTLTLPPGEGPFPVAILLAGAGNPNRTNLSYTSWSDHLARKGIAALAYDRRPDDEYGPHGFLHDLDTHADDVVSAIDQLAAHPAIDRDEIYLISRSRGGWIAFETAARDPRVSAIVGIGVAAVSMPEQDLQAFEARMRHNGEPETHIQEALAYTRIYFATARDPHLWPVLERAAADAAAQPWSEYVRIPKVPTDLEWFRLHLDTDPKPLIPALDTPMFLAWGSEDRTAPAVMNLPLFELLLTPAVRNASVLAIYEGAGHTMEGPLNVDDDPEIVWSGMNSAFLAEVTAWLVQLSDD